MNPPIMQTRRQFLGTAARSAIVAGATVPLSSLLAQPHGERPPQAEGIKVLNPRARVPVGLIIDDSTCLVNLNRFAMPQFAQTFRDASPTYQKTWRDWPVEIPDQFVRKFGEWCAEHGIKGKYSVVPYPACVGRLDRFLPGWTHQELDASLALVRTLMAPNWDIHPEMVTHTRVIDLRTGQPYPDSSTKFMENWDWTTGRSTDEIASYLNYALQILKNAGLTCEGITTPGGFGNQARPQLSLGTLQAVRAVFGAEIPHYFRDLEDRGDASVAPRVENASGLDGPDPRCVVSIVGCTGDWTGGWDCTPPGGVDRFITADLRGGRMVQVIQRGEPAIMVAHWTGIYWNGRELGFKIFQEVVRRLHERFDNLLWMKLCEVARYWAAKTLTRIERNGDSFSFRAPFAYPEFTVLLPCPSGKSPRLAGDPERGALREVSSPLKLSARTWCRSGQSVTVCFNLPKGESRLAIVA